MDKMLRREPQRNLCVVTDASDTLLGHIVEETCYNHRFRNNERFGIRLFFMDLPELR